MSVYIQHHADRGVKRLVEYMREFEAKRGLVVSLCQRTFNPLVAGSTPARPFESTLPPLRSNVRQSRARAFARRVHGVVGLHLCSAMSFLTSSGDSTLPLLAAADAPT